MKNIVFTILVNLTFSFCFGQPEKRNYIHIEDSLINNSKHKYYLIQKSFNQAKLDSTETLDFFCSISNCVDFFLYTYEETDSDSLITLKLKKLSTIFIQEKCPLILTTGIDGNGGRGFQNLDLITMKYGFIYVTVGDLSCFPGRIGLALRAFNEETETFLDEVNSKGWEETLETQIKNYKKQ